MRRPSIDIARTVYERRSTVMLQDARYSLTTMDHKEMSVDNVWDPTRTWAFIVGLLEWRRDDIYDSFPKEQRRDAQLVDLLIARGVPKEQVRYLQDRDATTAAINAAMAEHLAAAPAGSTLILYFCGHGGIDNDGNAFFVSYDAGDGENPGWPVAAIPDAIDTHFSGSHAILFADCCYSGRLAEVAVAQKRRVAYASLCSSLSSQVSTGNWTFTEGILAALRGEAYTDRNGSTTITLAELAAYIQTEMTFAEEQVAAFTTTHDFNPELVLSPARPRPDPQIGRQVVVKLDGTWYSAQVIDTRKDELKLRLYGYESSDDTWVSADAVRTIGRPRYPVGATVEVRWKNHWYVASVLDERVGVHQITYEGYSSEFNEWVSSKRIRPLL